MLSSQSGSGQLEYCAPTFFADPGEASRRKQCAHQLPTGCEDPPSESKTPTVPPGTHLASEVLQSLLREARREYPHVSDASHHKTTSEFADAKVPVVKNTDR